LQENATWITKVAEHLSGDEPIAKMAGGQNTKEANKGRKRKTKGKKKADETQKQKE